MQTIILERDNLPDIRFNGEEIASASSRRISGPGSNRWTELHLYRTDKGKLVCHQKAVSQWEGETDRYSAFVADSEAELVSLVGTDNLAKDLYAEAGIPCVEDI